MNFELNLVAYKTMVRKELTRSFRIWKQTFVPPVINTILYFIVFGSLIGQRIGEMGGFDYIEFIIPGLIMMTVINAAFMSTAAGFFIAKFQKALDELLISPVASLTIILSYVTSSVVVSFVIGLIILITAMFFVSITIFDLFTMLVFIFLTATTFSMLGLALGIFAKNFDDLSIVPTFVLTPLTFLGGVFYSIDLLPEFFRNLSFLNPILYMINGFRYGFIGISDVDIFFSLIMLLIFTGILFLLNYFLLETGINLKE
jgi:ABC-2 type transport system permease protein